MGRITRRVLQWPWPPFPVAYAACLLLIVFIELLRWPIISFDTDLWYHLMGGRYILTHLRVPQESFFSFISPPRPWVDYYWLFQAAVFQVFSRWGFYGLILLRALLCVATLGMVLWFVFHRRVRTIPWPWLAAVGISACAILLPRHLQVRPHLFSYCFIILVLSVLEHRPRWSWLLPIVGVCWANFHGITYPILYLLCGAYAIEYLWGSRRKHPDRTRVIAGIALSIASVLATPHGWRLLRIPFVSTAGASEYIMELAPTTLGDVLELRIVWLTPTIPTIFNIYLAVALTTCGVALWRRKASLSHMILLVAGCALIFKGRRFSHEFALLALPLLRAHSILPGEGFRRQLPRVVYLTGLFVALLMPLQLLAFFFGDRPAFPVSYRNLPQGVAAFLQQVNVGGRLLNHPNQGGYYQWMLWPRYHIFMDMEIPFMFQDSDMRLVADAFTKEQTLGRLLGRYDPSFIAVPIQSVAFADVIKSYPDFVPVFFDDLEALYANRRHHPDLVERFEFKIVKPFALVDKVSKDLLKEQTDRAGFLQEMLRILEIHPTCGIANHVVALAYNEDGAYGRALPFARALIARSPEVPAGYRLEADALKGLKAYDKAIASYRQAMTRSSPDARVAVSREIGVCLFELGRYRQAYQYLRRGVSVFAEPSEEDLYYLAAAALRVGRRREAEDIFTYVSEYRVNPADRVWIDRLEREFSALKRQGGGT
ncbi:MAG: tetratricopeptide repeat protein [Candidatus Omnitrophica bacterium]|nr:tetratricopeptide repeat protein [Candidatus Omnitrophota bacterium]